MVAAVALLWLPLVMAGSPLLLARAVAVPAFVAVLEPGCVLLSLALLWAWQGSCGAGPSRRSAVAGGLRGGGTAICPARSPAEPVVFGDAGRGLGGLEPARVEFQALQKGNALGSSFVQHLQQALRTAELLAG